MRLHVILIGLILTLGFASACGGESAKDTFVPVPGNSELVVGPNRIAIAIADNSNEALLGDPGNGVQLQFKTVEGELIGSPEDMTFVEAIPETSGFWVLRHNFESEGNAPALLTVTRGEETEEIDLTFRVIVTGKSPTIGAVAPRTENPTLSTQPNRKQITTDTEPSDAFYQLTVSQAIDAQKPFVVVFATPAFCQSSLCGPILDNVKAVQPEFADSINFIHIEPFILDAEGGLANGQLTASQSSTDWNLQTEPWIFVVGSDGKIADRLEGSASPDELRESLSALS